MAELKQFRPTFDEAPIDSTTPFNMTIYRDARSVMVRANREIALLSNIFSMASEWDSRSVRPLARASGRK